LNTEFAFGMPDFSYSVVRRSVPLYAQQGENSCHGGELFLYLSS